MTAIEVPPPPADSVRPEPGREGSWRISWSGVRTVAVLELRQRVRSTRWIVVLVVWVAVLAALTLLIRYAVHSALEPGVQLNASDAQQAADAQRLAGATLFGIIVFLVLSLGALVAPALTATSINGDRSAGVLAALQTTLLTPAEIAIGKLAAAWATALALLVTASPFVLWAYVDGGTPAGRLATTLAVLALTLLVVCAIGLGWSAITARTSSSTVLTYLSVIFLGLGLPLLFGLTLPLVQSLDTVRVNGMDNDTTCSIRTEVRPQFHSERSWWLLGASPYVVVADSAPKAERVAGVGLDDPLSAIRDAVREARLGPNAVLDECFLGQSSDALQTQRQAQRDALPATWPYGLAADLALGAAFSAVAVRRLTTPSRKLPRGTRVA